MLEWTAHALLAAFNSVPALLVAEDSPNFGLVRAMFGLGLIVLAAYALTMLRPVRSAIGRAMGKTSDSTVQKP